MIVRVYPLCDNCGGEINPNKYENCERYYVWDNEPICEECFKKKAIEIIESDPELAAKIFGVYVGEL